MRPPVRGVAACAAALTMLIAACSDDSSGSGDSAPSVELVSSLERFESCDELDAWAADELAPRVGAYGFEMPSPEADDMVVGEDMATEEFDEGEDAVAEPAEPAEPEESTEVAPEVPADGGVTDAPVDRDDSASIDDDAAVDAEAPMESPGEAPTSDGDGLQAESFEDRAAAEGAEAAPETAPSAADESAPDADAGGDAANAAEADAPDDDGPEYSETNVQVEGVDEPDIVKTDGERILAVANGQLHLASPDGAEVLDTVDLPDELYNAEMMLAGDRVLLFGAASFGAADAAPAVTGDGAAGISDTGSADDLAWSADAPGTSLAQVDIVGVDLELTDTFTLEGSYLSARMIGDVVRLVMHTDGHDRFSFVYPGGSGDGAEAQAAEVNQMLVENAEPEDFLPRWAEVDTDGEVLNEGTLLSCEQAHAPEEFAGFGMVSVVTIDVSEGVASGVDSSGGAGVMADGETVYSSHDNLYVASPEWVEWDSLSDEELSDADRDFGTDIHRFDIGDPTEAVYDISGRVAGRLLNQFALDEHEGRLRVATTTGSPWGGDDDLSESHVSVLEPDDGALVEVGSVSGLGEGESIHAVRFMGDVGYVVTFQQVDPLYTIDLSDPTDPQERGELKILGYSAYLHPVADGYLLGVGQDATEQGMLEGTQVSLFDVRDLDDPQRVAQETLPNADSAAEADHRAFLWWAETQLAAIPASTYDWEDADSFEGLVGFEVDIDAEEITEVGRISHPDQAGGYDDPIPLPEPMPLPEPGSQDEPGFDVDPAPPLQEWTPPIMRSWVIGDELWTLSGAGLASTDLETFTDTEFIEFPG